MKIFVSVLFAALSVCAYSRDTNQYDRVETRGGFTFSQRGGLGLSNEVVTAVSLPSVASNLAEGASFGPFSNAVSKVVSPVVHTAETDPFVSSWARRIDGEDAPEPAPRGDYLVGTDGTVTCVSGGITDEVGTVTFEVSLPRKLVEATKVSTNLVSSMTQSQKTRLLEAIVEYIRKKEGIAAPEVQ